MNSSRKPYVARLNLEPFPSTGAMAPPTVDQGERMDEMQTAPRWSRRRTCLLGITSLAAVAAVAGGWLLMTRPNGVSGSQSQNDLPLDVFVSDYGVRVAMDVTFADARDLISAEFSAGRRESEGAFFYSNDRDDDVEPEPFPVDPGRPVSVEDDLFPSCAAPPPKQVILTVRSELASGEEVTNTFTSSKGNEYAAGVRRWCSSGVHASIAGSSIQPDGTAEVFIRVANPGPRDARVELPGLRVRDVAWQPASVKVGGGTEAVLRVRGTGVRCGGPIPWTSDRLTTDVQPLRIEFSEQWC